LSVTWIALATGPQSHVPVRKPFSRAAIAADHAARLRQKIRTAASVVRGTMRFALRVELAIVLTVLEIVIAVVI
jgi:hypothetical protein